MKVLFLIKPDVIIHSAAEKKVENVEKDFDKALHLNKDATAHLAEISGNFNYFEFKIFEINKVG